MNITVSQRENKATAIGVHMNIPNVLYFETGCEL